MLKNFQVICIYLSKVFFVIVYGIFGYLTSLFFILLAASTPSETSPTYGPELFLVNFEIGLFFYLGYVHPSLIGVGWSIIFIMAYFRKRIIVISIFGILFAYACFATVNGLRRNIHWDKFKNSLLIFFDPRSSEFIVSVLPLAVILIIVLALTFRRQPRSRTPQPRTQFPPHPLSTKDKDTN
jgi:hypothetical protein